MNKTTTIVLLVLLFGLLAVAMFVSTPESPPPEVPPLFLEFSRSEVKSLDLEGPAGTVRLSRDAADPERWRVEVGGAKVRAESLRVEDLLNDLGRLAPKNRWKAQEVRPEERAAWGLDKPGLVLTLGLEGRSIRAAFGGRTPERQNTYAEREAGGDVFVVPASAVDRLEKSKAEDLRERSPAGMSSHDLQSLTVKRADGMVLEARGGGAGGTWEVTAPYRGAAEPEPMEKLLSDILSVKVVDFVADGAVDPDKYGLAKPRAEITLVRKVSGKAVVLRLGGEAPDGKTYFVEDGEPSVYTCGSALPRALAALDPASLRDRNLLRIGWARIDSVEYVHPEKGWKLLRVLDRWDVEKPERVPAEQAEVDRLLEDLRKLEVERFLDGEDPGPMGLRDPAKAAARLEIRGTDDAGNRSLLLGGPGPEGSLRARLLPREGSGDDPPAVLLPAAFGERLAAGWLSWKDRSVLKLDLAEVRGLSRRDANGEEAYRREGGGWKASPGGPEPDGEALTLALTHLLNLRCTEYEARTKEGLEKWGLAIPPAAGSLTLHLSGADGKGERTTTLLLGKAMEGGGSHYARLADGDYVFRLADNVLHDGAVVRWFDAMTAEWRRLPKEPEAPPKQPEAPPKEPEAPPKEPEKPK